MNLKSFYMALAHADWHYVYSDDGFVTRRGHEAMEKLKAEASTSPEHQALFDAFKNHKLCGGAVPSVPA